MALERKVRKSGWHREVKPVTDETYEGLQYIHPELQLIEDTYI